MNFVSKADSPLSSHSKFPANFTSDSNSTDFFIPFSLSTNTNASLPLSFRSIFSSLVRSSLLHSLLLIPLFPFNNQFFPYSSCRYQFLDQTTSLFTILTWATWRFLLCYTITYLLLLYFSLSHFFVSFFLRAGTHQSTNWSRYAFTPHKPHSQHNFNQCALDVISV